MEICTLLRKPEALQMPVEVKYVGWDIPNEFVVGYGLDYRERYRNLRDIGTLAPARLQLSPPLVEDVALATVTRPRYVTGLVTGARAPSSTTAGTFGSRLCVQPERR